MHAIANYILKNNPKANVLYVTSEEFTNEYVNSIRNNTTYKFRDKYRSLDVLLIDDIQFLADKESTQEEFFNTFNALYRNNGQIVISSDRTPKEINNLEDRIKSRFEWGIVADIQPPNYETRLAILRKKEDIEGYTIDDEIIKYIASNIKSNIRTLEGALQKIVLKSRLEKARWISIPLPLFYVILSETTAASNGSPRRRSSPLWPNITTWMKKTCSHQKRIKNWLIPDRSPCICAAKCVTQRRKTSEKHSAAEIIQQLSTEGTKLQENCRMIRA